MLNKLIKALKKLCKRKMAYCRDAKGQFSKKPK